MQSSTQNQTRPPALHDFIWTQNIFSHLNIDSLLCCAQVSRSWYSMARTNNAWHMQYNRIIRAVPELQPLFDKYSAQKTTNGTRYVKKRKTYSTRKEWVTPKGYWYVFTKYLMQIPREGGSYTRVFGRYSDLIVIRALMAALIRTNLPLGLGHWNHIVKIEWFGDKKTRIVARVIFAAPYWSIIRKHFVKWYVDPFDGKDLPDGKGSIDFYAYSNSQKPFLNAETPFTNEWRQSIVWCIPLRCLLVPERMMIVDVDDVSNIMYCGVFNPTTTIRWPADVMETLK